MRRRGTCQLQLLCILAALGLLLSPVSLAQGEVEVKQASWTDGRYGASAVWTGEEALIFGGGTRDLEQEPGTDTIWRYDPSSDALGLADARLPERRVGTAAAWTGQAAIIVSGHGDCSGPCSTLVAYDPATDSASTLTPTLPDDEANHAAAGLDGLVYILGGGSGTIRALDPAAESLVTQPTTLPSGFEGAAAAAYDGTIYLFGGTDADRRCTDRIVAYTPSQDQAATLDARLPHTLCDATAVSVGDGRLFVFGGLGSDGPVASILVYDTTEGALTVMDTELPTARSQSASAWTGEEALAFGGRGQAPSNGGVADLQIVGYTPPPGPEPAEGPGEEPAGETNHAPVASFNASHQGLTVTVDASTSHDPDGSLDALTWTWGDGAQETSGPAANHTYDQAGTYTITLTATDDQGASAQTNLTVELATDDASTTHSSTSSDPNATGTTDGPSSSTDGQDEGHDPDTDDGVQTATPTGSSNRTSDDGSPAAGGDPEASQDGGEGLPDGQAADATQPERLVPGPAGLWGWSLVCLAAWWLPRGQPRGPGGKP